MTAKCPRLVLLDCTPGFAGRAPLAPWIRNGQILICDISHSGIAIHTPYAQHVRCPCAIDTQLIRNMCEIVAPEMFRQTAILLRICSYLRTPYERRGIAGQWNGDISDRCANGVLERCNYRKCCHITWFRRKPSDTDVQTRRKYR